MHSRLGQASRKALLARCRARVQLLETDLGAGLSATAARSIRRWLAAIAQPPRAGVAGLAPKT